MQQGWWMANLLTGPLGNYLLKLGSSFKISVEKDISQNINPQMLVPKVSPPFVKHSLSRESETTSEKCELIALLKFNFSESESDDEL